MGSGLSADPARCRPRAVAARSLDGNGIIGSNAFRLGPGSPATALAHIMPVIEAIRAEGITSLYGIARELDRRGMRGGKWHPATVKLLLARSS